MADRASKPTFRQFPNRASWLAARKQTLGGSDVAALLGAGNRTALEVQQDKLATEASPDEWNLRYATGSALEPVVATEASRALSLALVDPSADGPVMYYSPDLPHAHCTPDRFGLVKRPKRVHLAGLTEKAEAVVSLKTWTMSRQNDWTGVPPLYALIQLQHEMLVTGVQKGFITVVFGAGEGSYTTEEIGPHSALQARLRAEIPEWWERHIVRQEPVPATSADVGFLNSIYPQSKTGSWIYLDREHWTRNLVKLDKIKRLQGRLGEMRDGIEADIKQAMGETEMLVIGDASVAASWKTSVRNEAPREARTTTTRTLRIVKTPKEIQKAIASGLIQSAGELKGATE